MSQNNPHRWKRVIVIEIILLIMACSAAVGVYLLYPPVIEIIGIHPYPAPTATMNPVEEELQGRVAFNSPKEIQLDDYVTIEAFVQPLKEELPAEDLSSQITGPGEKIEETLRISEEMTAELISAKKDAFDIQPIHLQAAQVLSLTEPTKWAWIVTARKSGKQVLILTLYRKIGEADESARIEKTFERELMVTVPFRDRFSQFDWKWLLGLLIPVMIAAFWKWVDSREKKKKHRRGSLR